MTSLLICGLVAVIVSTGNSASGQEVDTTHGKIIGLRTSVLSKPIDTYYGIPFAKPPIGDLRFKHPQPMDPWRPEVKDARAQKPSCQQAIQFSLGMAWRAIPPSVSEDCLYINVWAPANVTANAKLATMVWVYGGSFTSGSINMPLYSGKYLAAEKNVIVMSMNYRLGAHGFLYLGPDTFPGNQGLMDQTLALQWIHNNVERFGGDANMITLFGESAGAGSVGHLLLSPKSRDLFTRAILQSGSPLPAWAVQEPSMAIGSTRRLAEMSNCSARYDADIYQCIKDLPPGTIVDNQARVFAVGGVPFGPVVDGFFLPDTPIALLEKGEMKKTEILMGVNKNEGTLFLPSTMPTVFTLSNQINVTRTQFLLAVRMFAATNGQSSTMVKAIMAQYDEVQVPSLRKDYLETVDNILGDSFFKCPSVKLADFYAVENDVYFYSFDHRISAFTLPLWMGVPHSAEMEMMFGQPLGDAFAAPEEEKLTSRSMMTYWANFAKTGNPNLPETPNFQWPRYSTTDETFLVFTAAGQSTNQGLRKQQCVFWDTLMPLITENDDTRTGSETTTEKVVYVCQNDGSRMPLSLGLFWGVALATLFSI
ncbi:acetylcholinesterase-like [Haliotis rufescens]|uniref:acetylcholinesterase-like n=1 Tax=Haliotis rufescens TaxID=6454 RepID=UPI00201F24E7|nr:acetylcholinesterase-like [Haliotis rufescens]XP_046347309.2 acetylcholinesterase-like [Haliotis rufescens]XP_046347311.2 acetylcholinesterase-like [Haliotis rufescens]XP_046347312.2 acetylcholinesterase-like [Haliotis rufescens]XP_046347313.2 acetylcholinesterase-like [Haliotis rufescens]XP_048251718.1 acetylcholinesterase-like [Haliotis rufescens]